MISGYLCKRNSPISPPPMQKVYCVLWGTLLLDYETEEDSKSSLAPKSAMELIGVSDWDGQGRVNKYPHGFLAVSHTGTTYYMSAMSATERDDWVLHIKTALECNFANTELLQFKPSKASHKIPEHRRNAVCHKTGLPFNNAISVICRCCGNNYSPEYVQDSIPVLQIGIEEAEKICSNCRNSQIIIIWIKCLNYTHAMLLHESTPAVLQSITRFKSSFKLRRTKSARLDMAAKMYEENLINVQEFEELRKVDRNFLREWTLEESARLKLALDVIDNDLHTVIGMLINPHATESGGTRSYYELVHKIIELAEVEADLIDFYWPQILHTHLRISKYMTISSISKIDLLQQCILVISLRYPQLAMKTAWTLLAVANDFIEKRITPTQYAASMTLLLLLQSIISGSVPALSTDKSTSTSTSTSESTVLGSCIIPTTHQKIEIKVELRILMRCRRKLLEVQDYEDLLSKHDRLARIPENATRSSSNNNINNSSSSGNINTNNDVLSIDSSSVLFPSPKNSTSSNSIINVSPTQGKYLKTKSISNFENSNSNNGNGNGNNSTVDNSNNNSNINSNNNNDKEIYSNPMFLARSRSYSIDSNPLRRKNLLELMRNLGKEEKNENLSGIDYVVAAPTFLTSRNELSNQLEWMHVLTTIVDDLRHIDRPLRTERLRDELIKLNKLSSSSSSDSVNDNNNNNINNNNNNSNVKNTSSSSSNTSLPLPSSTSLSSFSTLGLGFDPTTVAGEPRYKLTNILIDLCRVFRTKARAPSLIVCEVQRVDDEFDDPYELKRMLTPQKTCDLHLEDVDSILKSEVKQALEVIHRRESQDTMMTMTQDSSSPSPLSPLKSFSKQQQQQQRVVYATDDDMHRHRHPNHSHNMELETSSTHPNNNINSHNSHSSLSYNRQNVKSARLAAHRKTGGQFAVQVASGSFMSLLGTSSSEQLHSYNNNSNSNGNNLRISKSSSDLQSADNDVDMDASNTNVSDDLSASIRQRVTLSEENETISSESSTPTPNTHGVEVEVEVGMIPNNDFIPSNNNNGDLIDNNSKFIDNNDSRENDYIHSDWIDVQPITDHDHDTTTNSSTNNSNNKNIEMIEISSNLTASIHAQPCSDIVTTHRVQSSAKTLLTMGTITENEYLTLLKGDAKYRELSAKEEAAVAAIRIGKCFGESWDNLKERILFKSNSNSSSNNSNTSNKIRNELDNNNNNNNNQPNNNNINNNNMTSHSNSNSKWPQRDLRSFIVKSNDDLRQEMCCMQLLELCLEIFNDSGLSHLLWLKKYHIISTGSSTGVIQTLPDTLSLDALKKTDDFISLSKYFERVYGTSPERLSNARKNFLISFAAYSLICHIFQIKDRHNGNILIDKDGHIIHIDFGFLLGIAPGGSFSLETAPFKFTEEMVEVLGGIDSPLFSELVRAFTTGFLALQANAENIVSTLEMLATDSPFPCFLNKDRVLIIEKLRSRFRTDLNVEETVHHCMDLITQSYGHLGTRQYDTFQWFTNGITP